MTTLMGRFARNFVCLFAFIVVAACSTAQPSGAAPFAAFVQDARSGEVLFSDNADTRLHPASLTKMMTLYITFEEIERGNLSLDTIVTVSKNAASQPPSRLGLKAGQKIAVRYLIRAAAIKSANDAASALGDAIGGDEARFAARMTRTAKALGMKNSTFKNANGLTRAGHLSSARDMSTLGRRLFYDFPQYYNIFSRRTTDAGLASVRNTNTRFLDAYSGADGIKTGYTVAAGFNLTASAERGGVRIIATVFGGKSTAWRNAKIAELLDLGFRKAPANARTTPPSTPVYQADEENALVAQSDGLPEVEGGFGKTIRLQMAVAKSPRPAKRPTAEAIAATEVAVSAIEDSIAAALAEAVAEPPPPGTLDAQAVALAEGTSEDEAIAEAAPKDLAATDLAPAEGAQEAVADAGRLALAPPARPETLIVPQAAPVEVAEATPAVEDTTEPVDTEVALADAIAIPDPAVESAPVGTLEAQALALLSPETSLQAQAQQLAATDDPAEGELIVTDAVQLAAIAPPVAPKRNAPIFDRVESTSGGVTTQEPVVIRLSTSNARHYGVHLGKFNTRSEAERLLLKTQLAESATLNEGLRKVVQKGGGYQANFMGLTQEQADLACRRLQARAVQCFTLGP